MDDFEDDDYYKNDNNSTNESDVHVHYRPLAVPVFLAVLAFIGFIGNICMMYAILGHKHMRTAPNILIFNLALGDLLYILIPTTIYIEHELDPHFNLPEAVCKLKSYLENVAQYVSVFALAALSRERFTAIVRGMESLHGGKDSCMSTSLFVVSVVWLASILFCVPTLFFAEAKQSQCRSTPDNDDAHMIYESIRALIGYVIPLVIVGVYYVKIALSLFRSTRRFHSDYETPAMAQQVKVRKRLAASVLVITVFFAICWFPYFFYNIWIISVSTEIRLAIAPTIADHTRYAGVVMPVINTCLDPWLLFLISSKHRACLVRCLCCFGKGQASGDGPRSKTSQMTGRIRMSHQGTSFSRVSRL